MAKSKELLTPLAPQYHAGNVQKLSIFLDFAPKLTFFAKAFIFGIWNSKDSFATGTIVSALSGGLAVAAVLISSFLGPNWRGETTRSLL